MSGSRKASLMFLLTADSLLGGQGVDRTTLVKRLFLAEQLHIIYSLWSSTYKFFRYNYGPFSKEVFTELEFLVFHGLVEVQEFHSDHNRIFAIYRISPIGKLMAIQMNSSNEIAARQYSLFTDLTICLQELGVQTAKQICNLVYQEPEFKTLLEKERLAGRGMLIQDLPNVVTGRNQSFAFQVVIRGLLAELKKDSNARDYVRAYLRFLISSLGRSGHALEKEVSHAAR